MDGSISTVKVISSKSTPPSLLEKVKRQRIHGSYLPEMNILCEVFTVTSFDLSSD